MTTVVYRKRRVWLWVVLVCVIAALVGAYFVGDSIARTAVEDKVRSLIRSGLELDADHPIDVTVEGPVLLQLAKGSLDKIEAHAHDVTYAGITGSVDGVGTGVRFDGTAETYRATTKFTAEQIKAILPTDYLDWTTVSVKAPNIAIGAEPEVFGVPVPVQVWFAPSSASGDVVLTPNAFAVAGADVTADDIIDTFGNDAKRYVEPWQFCVDFLIPKAVSVADITVDGDQLAITADVDPQVVTDPSLRENGTCG